MKKSFMMMAMVAMVFASCKKEPTPAPVEVDPLDNGPVPVEFTVGQPNIEVKSTGTVGGITTAENVWNGETVFIYAFENTKKSTDPLEYNAVPDLTKKNPLINGNANVVKSNANENFTTLNPKQEDGATTTTGASIAGEPYYYQNTAVYSFFGYHIDDAWNVGTDAKDPATNKPAIDETKGVVIPIKIDGGQDIMIAMANPQADIDARGKNDGVENKYVPVHRAYSAFSARRNVVPNLNFEHLLTRFTFEVVAGAKSAYNIEIQSLTVASKNTADLVVVSKDNTGRGLTNIGTDKVQFALKERKSASDRTLQTLTPFQFKEDPKDFDVEHRETVALGESIMVIPGETEYDLVLKTKLVRPLNGTTPPNTPAEDYTTKITYSSIDGDQTAGKFEAGKSYKITLVVYGLEQIEVKATLQNWKDGGSFEYDPDKDEVVPSAQS